MTAPASNPVRRARPYQHALDHPETIPHVTGMARLVLHAARRSETDATTDPARRRANALIRDRADAIATRFARKDE